MRISSLEKLISKKFCMLTKSGSTAVYLLIKCLEIKNKIVIIPANICFDIVLAILFSGNKPVVFDVDRNQCLSFKSLKKYRKIRKVGAIIYPYMYGNYGEVLKIKNFAKKNNVFFIEDVAPSLGLKIAKKYAGNISEYSFCSFGQGKIVDMNIGGSLNVNSEEIYYKALFYNSKLKIFSKKQQNKYAQLNKMYQKIIDKKISKQAFRIFNLKKYKDSLISKYKFNKKFLKSLNAKILKIRKINLERNMKASLFQKIIKNREIELIKHKKGAVYWRQNALVNKDRDKLIKFLSSRKIYARKYFPSLDSVFPFITNKNLKLVKKFELKILNFWVGKETKKRNIIITNNHINSFFTT